MRILPILLVLSLGAGGAWAGLDVEFSAGIQIGDDDDLFLGISARYYDRDRGEVDRWYAKFRDPDDLSVALFVSRHSGRSLAEIHLLRSRGISWWDIGLRYNVPADVWFVPVEVRPGPPYGKAYGHWKKHRRDVRAYRISDGELRSLVVVRMAHEYYGIPVATAMEWRAGGADARVLMSREYRERHGMKAVKHRKRGGQPARAGNKPGRSKGKGKNR